MQQLTLRFSVEIGGNVLQCCHVSFHRRPCKCLRPIQPLESTERTSWQPLVKDSHVCGVESGSGLSGSPHGIAAAAL